MCLYTHTHRPSHTLFLPDNVSPLTQLIPEFFGDDPSFLENKLGLDLGRKQNGSFVGDVILPPWATGDFHEKLYLLCGRMSFLVEAHLPLFPVCDLLRFQ